MRKLTVCALFGILALHETAVAQALGISTGWYSGLSAESLSGTPVDSSQEVSLDRKIPLLFEFYAGSFFNEDRRSRFGLRLHIYQATANFAASPDSTSASTAQGYTMTSILLSYQYRLSDPGEGYFIFDLAGGFSVHSAADESQRRFSLVPGVVQIFRISSNVGLQAGLRLHIIMGSSFSSSPFRSGLLLSLGLIMDG